MDLDIIEMFLSSNSDCDSIVNLTTPRICSSESTIGSILKSESCVFSSKILFDLKQSRIVSL